MTASPFPPGEMTARLARVRRALTESAIDALVVACRRSTLEAPYPRRPGARRALEGQSSPGVRKIFQSM